jgi:hypothetical protein
MFFLKNTFILLYAGVEKNNFLNISFKKKYKLYTFFKKYESYFVKFFDILNIKGLTPYLYVNFVQFLLKKNFSNNRFKTWANWVSDENLFFCVVYYLNKSLKVSGKKIKQNKIFNLSQNLKSIFKNKNILRNNWVYNNYKNFARNNLQNSLINNLSTYRINYSGTSLGKFLNDNSLDNLSIYFLRKTRTFNKGRYSRNRQNYRTGVYWCLYINIMVLFGLYFYFYRFTLNFGYLWWLFFSLIASFFVPRAIKFRLYNPKVLFKLFLESQPLVLYLFNRKI